MRRTPLIVTPFALATLVMACGSDGGPSGGSDVFDPFSSRSGNTTIVGDGRGGRGVRTPSGSDCVEVGDECIRPQDKCGKDARADVVVDSKGKVIEIICYPADDNPPIVESDGDVDLDKENNGIITLDGVADGVDIEGNVTSQGNNVTIYGQGADVSVIGGNVEASGNNFSARGVTVKGNVEIDANNGTLVLSVIEGDVVYRGNNFVMAETVVLGNVLIYGNNAKLVGNAIAGRVQIEGNNAYCDGNRQRLESGQLGETIRCD